MTPREPRDLATILLLKAAQDQTALSKLAEDADIADEIVGFHAHQAVEKCIKAVLTAMPARGRWP